jgi:hypothetical protein
MSNSGCVSSAQLLLQYLYALEITGEPCRIGASRKDQTSRPALLTAFDPVPDVRSFTPPPQPSSTPLYTVPRYPAQISRMPLAPL